MRIAVVVASLRPAFFGLACRVGASGKTELGFGHVLGWRYGRDKPRKKGRTTAVRVNNSAKALP